MEQGHRDFREYLVIKFNNSRKHAGPFHVSHLQICTEWPYFRPSGTCSSGHSPVASLFAVFTNSTCLSFVSAQPEPWEWEVNLSCGSFLFSAPCGFQGIWLKSLATWPEVDCVSSEVGTKKGGEGMGSAQSQDGKL